LKLKWSHAIGGLALLWLGASSFRVRAQAPLTFTNLVSSSFDVLASGVDGWRGTNDESQAETIAYRPTNGFPSGYISWNEAGADGARTYFVAPAKFLGDKRAAYNGTLRFSLRRSSVNNTIQIYDDIIIGSTNGAIAWRFPAIPPAGGWLTFDVPLNENAGWVTRSPRHLATQEEMLAALSAINGLWIRAEYVSGGDTADLDAVVLFGQASGPLQPILTSNTYVGISIEGQVGRSYRIEYRDALAPSTAWQRLADLVLPMSPYLFLDQTSPASSRRFYRAILSQ
jgi:hypothetical protein